MKNDFLYDFIAAPGASDGDAATETEGKKILNLEFNTNFQNKPQNLYTILFSRISCVMREFKSLY